MANEKNSFQQPAAITRGGLSLYQEILLIFVHVGEVKTFHGEAQAEFEAANVVAFRYERVAVAVQVDELVKQFELLTRQHRAQFVVNSCFAFVNVGVLLCPRRGYNLVCKVAVKKCLNNFAFQ